MSLGVCPKSLRFFAQRAIRCKAAAPKKALYGLFTAITNAINLNFN